jgi:S1-C subfamily serine protease
VPELIRYGKVEKPVLGITIANDSVARRFGFEGVLILSVLPGGAADEAKLLPTRRDMRGEIVLGVIIVAIDNEKISESKDIFRILDSHKIGDNVKVTVRRRDDEVNVDVRLQAKT